MILYFLLKQLKKLNEIKKVLNTEHYLEGVYPEKVIFKNFFFYSD